MEGKRNRFYRSGVEFLAAGERSERNGRWDPVVGLRVCVEMAVCFPVDRTVFATAVLDESLSLRSPASLSPAEFHVSAYRGLWD